MHFHSSHIAPQHSSSCGDSSNLLCSLYQLSRPLSMGEQQASLEPGGLFYLLFCMQKKWIHTERSLAYLMALLEQNCPLTDESMITATQAGFRTCTSAIETYGQSFMKFTTHGIPKGDENRQEEAPLLLSIYPPLVIRLDIRRCSPIAWLYLLSHEPSSYPSYILTPSFPFKLSS